MAQRMLIDAVHAEETRVVILDGSRLEHFDFESSTKKQLKGNIYLAKVTRVEPSLQAAFIDYGGNRHGFLSFNEIHPDYYQIPIADREALSAEVAASDESDADTDVPDAVEQDSDGQASDEDNGDNGDDGDNGDEGDDKDAGRVDTDFEEVGGDEVEEREDIEVRRVRPQRHYRIQEVIKRRQVLLVQVVKEERGTKGAALTTYLSLAGRYCVLMPNSARGGGISRKIANPDDRKRLRAIAKELPVAEGVGVILRTAGMERSKAEIKRDFTYLVKLWESVRQLTFVSTAPTLIHEEASLISRALRDLYSKEIEEVLIEGEEGYRTAKDFMRMLTPSHARRIKAYSDTTPLFHRFQVESMLDAFHSSTVRLKSGGYIVINPTEALVAIDVNSGRATRERNIEETATKTNLEAAEEIARQLRLRDLAGLIVIDFIDMENARNIRIVERCMKDSMKGDRARIQLGRISHFGLMEMSRQRLRSSLLEASSNPCPHCDGSGQIRSTESTALHVLRAIEEEGILARNDEITVHVPGVVALYILNQKRTALIDIEKRHGFVVILEGDDSLIPPNYRLERTGTRSGAEVSEEADEGDGEKSGRKRRRRRSRGQRGDEAEGQTATDVMTDQDAKAGDAVAADADGDQEGADQPVETRDSEAKADGVRKRRRRGKRGGRRRRGASSDQLSAETSAEAASDETPAAATPSEEAVTEGEDDQSPREAQGDVQGDVEEVAAAEPEAAPAKPRRSRRRPAKDKTAADGKADDAEAKPKRARRSRRKTTVDEPAAESSAESSSESSASVQTTPSDGGNGSPRTDQPVDIVVPASETPTPDAVADTVTTETIPPKPPSRKGWWNKLTGK